MTPISPVATRGDLIAMIHNRDALISDFKKALAERPTANAMAGRTVSEDDLARVLYEAEFDADTYPWENTSSAEQLTYKSQAEAALRKYSIRALSPKSPTPTPTESPPYEGGTSGYGPAVSNSNGGR